MFYTFICHVSTKRRKVIGSALRATLTMAEHAEKFDEDSLGFLKLVTVALPMDALSSLILVGNWGCLQPLKGQLISSFYGETWNMM